MSDQDQEERAAEQRKYETVWTFDSYREVSPGARAAEQLQLVEVLRKHEVRSVLDAGCGSGKLLRHILETCGDEFDVHGFDIASNCLDPWFAPIRDRILTVGCLWDAADFNQDYDAILCTDVLEHVPTEHVPQVLRNFRTRARRLVYLAVALLPDCMGEQTVGRALHLTVKPPAWWRTRLSKTLRDPEDQ